jgi:DNA-binding transcriptional MerR regulator
MSDKRDEYIARFKAELDKTDARIREIEAQLDEYSAQTRKRYCDTLRELNDRRASLHRQLDELQQSSQESFDWVRSEAEKSWNQFLDRVDEVTRRLRTK